MWKSNPSNLAPRGLIEVRLDKHQIRNLIANLWRQTPHQGSGPTMNMLETLKGIGFAHATRVGFSISLGDLMIPPQKGWMVQAAYVQEEYTEFRGQIGELGPLEQFQRVIQMWNLTSEVLKTRIVEHMITFDPRNPVYTMATSGARGSMSQVRQLAGMRGLMANPKGQAMEYSIRGNFREGLTLAEFAMSGYGGRKGLVDTALRTADAGYLTRRLVDASQGTKINAIDCGTRWSIPFESFVKGDPVKSIIGRVIGVYPLEGLFSGENLWLRYGYQPHTVLTRAMGQNLQLVMEKYHSKASALEPITDPCRSPLPLRSPLSCGMSISPMTFTGGVQPALRFCQLCYGWDYAEERVVELGESVGVVAGQSIGEPGTQLTMRTFHTGGVFEGGGAQIHDTSPQMGVLSLESTLHLDENYVLPGKHMLCINSPFRGYAMRTEFGERGLVTNENLKMKITSSQGSTSFMMPRGSFLYVQPNQWIEEGQTLYDPPGPDHPRWNWRKQISRYTISAEGSGQIWYPLARIGRQKRGFQVGTQKTWKSIYLDPEEKLKPILEFVDQQISPVKEFFPSGEFEDKYTNIASQFYLGKFENIDLSFSKWLGRYRGSRTLGNQKQNWFVSIRDLFVEDQNILPTTGELMVPASPSHPVWVLTGNLWSFGFTGTAGRFLPIPQQRKRFSQWQGNSFYEIDEIQSTFVLGNKYVPALSTGLRLVGRTKLSFPTYPREVTVDQPKGSSETFTLFHRLLNVTGTIHCKKELLVRTKEQVPISKSLVPSTSGRFLEWQKQLLPPTEIRYIRIYRNLELCILSDRNIRSFGAPETAHSYSWTIGSIIRQRDPLGSNLYAPLSGQWVEVSRDCRRIRSAMCVPIHRGKSWFYTHHRGFVHQGQTMAKMAYNRQQTSDIVQGLPSIDRMFEGRKRKAGVPIPDGIRFWTMAEYRMRNTRTRGLREGSRHSDLQGLPTLLGLRVSLVHRLQTAYQDQGVQVGDHHFELIVRRMTSSMVLRSPGNTGILPGETVLDNRAQNLTWASRNSYSYPLRMQLSSRPGCAPFVSGLTKTALRRQAFLGAVSFQESALNLKPLLVFSKIDFGRGLKSKILIHKRLGNHRSTTLNPASNGFSFVALQANEKDMVFMSSFSREECLRQVFIPRKTRLCFFERLNNGLSMSPTNLEFPCLNPIWVKTYFQTKKMEERWVAGLPTSSSLIPVSGKRLETLASHPPGDLSSRHSQLESSGYLSPRSGLIRFYPRSGWIKYVNSQTYS